MRLKFLLILVLILRVSKQLIMNNSYGTGWGGYYSGAGSTRFSSRHRQRFLSSPTCPDHVWGLPRRWSVWDVRLTTHTSNAKVKNECSQKARRETLSFGFYVPFRMTVSSSGLTVLNVRVAQETVLAQFEAHFAWNYWGKPLKTARRKASLRAEIWTQDLSGYEAAAIPTLLRGSSVCNKGSQVWQPWKSCRY